MQLRRFSLAASKVLWQWKVSLAHDDNKILFVQRFYRFIRFTALLPLIFYFFALFSFCSLLLLSIPICRLFGIIIITIILKYGRQQIWRGWRESINDEQLKIPYRIHNELKHKFIGKVESARNEAKTTKKKKPFSL